MILLSTKFFLLLGLLPSFLAQGPSTQDEWIEVGQVCYHDVYNLCGATSLLSPQKTKECLERLYNGEEIGDLSDQCRDALSKIPENIPDIDPDNLHRPPGPDNGGPPCFRDVTELCNPEERANFARMTKCLEANYEQLSDRCKASIDNKGNKVRKNIPSHFLQSENKDVTKAIIIIAIIVLLGEAERGAKDGWSEAIAKEKYLIHIPNNPSCARFARTPHLSPPDGLGVGLHKGEGHFCATLPPRRVQERRKNGNSDNRRSR